MSSLPWALTLLVSSFLALQCVFPYALYLFFHGSCVCFLFWSPLFPWLCTWLPSFIFFYSKPFLSLLCVFLMYFFSILSIFMCLSLSLFVFPLFLYVFMSCPLPVSAFSLFLHVHHVFVRLLFIFPFHVFGLFQCPYFLYAMFLHVFVLFRSPYFFCASVFHVFVLFRSPYFFCAAIFVMYLSSFGVHISSVMCCLLLVSVFCIFFHTYHVYVIFQSAYFLCLCYVCHTCVLVWFPYFICSRIFIMFLSSFGLHVSVCFYGCRVLPTFGLHISSVLPCLSSVSKLYYSEGDSASENEKLQKFIICKIWVKLQT